MKGMSILKLSDKIRNFDPHGKIAEKPRFFSDLNTTEISGELRCEVIREADQSLDTPIPVLPAHMYADFTRNGNRSNYEALYFLRRNVLMARGMALQCSGDEKYFDPMLDALWAILEETTWVIPAHHRLADAKFPPAVLPDYDGAQTDNLDLFSAATGADLALIYFWHRERLDACVTGVANRIDRMLRERILHPLMTVNDRFWMKGVNNWTPWIISNVYTVLLALDLTTEERENVVARTLPMLAAFVDTYHSDGGCDEGPSYWGKAPASLFDCLEALYDLTGGAFDVFDDPLLRNMGEYVAKAYIAGRYYLNFADAPGVLSLDGSLIARFGRRIGSEVLDGFGKSIVSACGNEEMYTPANSRSENISDSCHKKILKSMFDATAPYRMVKNLLTCPEPMDQTPLFGEVWLDGLQVMAVREYPEQADKGLFFACKGGSNGENHNHNDVGSFIVYQDGKPLLPDLGVGTYTKFTFDSIARWKIFSMQSSYHNLMEIGGHMQLPGGEYHAETVSQGNGMVSLDLKKACPPDVKAESWIRTMGLQNHEVRVEDRFKLKEPQSVCWHMIAFEKPEVGKDRFLFRKAELAFDSALNARIEEHVFEDQRFVKTWGVDRFYRLVLEAPEGTTEGNFAVTVRARG